MPTLTASTLTSMVCCPACAGSLSTVEVSAVGLKLVAARLDLSPGVELTWPHDIPL